MKRAALTLFIIVMAAATAAAQHTHKVADSIRRVCKIPEIGYAVVTADSVLDMYLCGVRKAGTQQRASYADRFRIGSNTKAVTCFIAAQLVKQGRINWDTRFFDLFPQLRSASNSAYYQLTLLDLLTFRTHLFAWTYTNATPVKEQFSGSDSLQRYQFAKWFLATQPAHLTDTIGFSNLGYVAAGLMLEKAAGSSYQTLVNQLGKQLDIAYDFGQPNAKNRSQTWGHNGSLVPEAPADNYKLNWLMAAGNINATIPGHARFLQQLLKGYRGSGSLLSAPETAYLFQARPVFALGWFSGTDDAGNPFYTNTGNPGSFLTKIIMFPTLNRAILIFTNVQSSSAEEGIDELLAELEQKWVY